MKNLRNARKNNSLTMKELGQKIGVSESTISLYENGKRQPDNETIIKLSNILNCSTDYLLGIDENKKMPADENISEQDKKLFNLLRDLNPDEVQRVHDFVEGLKANR